MTGADSGSGGTDDVLLARAYLSRVAEPASGAVWRFVRDVGPAAAAAAIRESRAPDDVRSATEARRDEADPHDDIESAARHGIRLVIPESDEWPHFALGSLERAGERVYVAGTSGGRRADVGDPVPPLALWVRGNGELASLGVASIGIVGARASTAYGDHVTADIAYGLARRGVVVVSGGAYGIDAAAHRAALAGAGQTVIVSAGGIDRPYPAGNSTLFARATEAGLVLSESPPGTTPQRHRFLRRNRLIAALSAGVVVVEAGHRSGAANTAGHGFLLGRPVMAVPGPITSPMSAGCHALLRRVPEPAVLVTSVDDILEATSIALSAGTASAHAATTPAEARRDTLDGLDPVARRVFEGLSARTFARPESIAVRSGVPVLEVLRALPALELFALVDISDDGYRAAAAPR
ncbi:MAG: processing protein [Pseudonocardiales bacterium]|jgi:DNA processing protein|nr:processing protein [Pseudonocardiales bacterium]